MQLTRYDRNPIFAPTPRSPWESLGVSDPAVHYDGSKVRMLYQASGTDAEHRSTLGLAESADGLIFQKVSEQPVFGPSKDGFDAGTMESPRLVKFGERFVLSYSARPFPPGHYWKGSSLTEFTPALAVDAPLAVRSNLSRGALAITKDFKSWIRLGPITNAGVDDTDVVIFPDKIDGEFVLLHRPASWIGPQYNCKKPGIWISFSDDLLIWSEDHLLAQPHYRWEGETVAAGAPPVKTPDGWILLYYGVDASGVHRVGAMLLDLKDPLRVLARTRAPILEPSTIYEKNGLQPNAMRPTGAAVIDDRLHAYYSGARTYACVATCPIGELVGHLLENEWKEPA